MATVRMLGGITLSFLVGSAAAPACTYAQSPSPRGHHTLFYDVARERVMLTGGAVNHGRASTLLNDLWSFDGTRWTSHGTSGEPIASMRMAADAQRTIYSFGGWREGVEHVGELRVLERDQWRLVGTHPSVVASEAGFVFDARRNRFVLLASTAHLARNDIWEYDGTRWLRSTASPPPARMVSAMVYDERRGKTVVFGGQGARVNGGNAPMLGDTWEFDGTTWTRRAESGPAGRMGAGATYDSKRGLVLLFGGANHQGVMNDLWAWDGAAWKKLAEGGPEPRVMGHIAYDRKRDRVVLFGGRRGAPDDTDLGDTWEWDGATWRKVAP